VRRINTKKSKRKKKKKKDVLRCESEKAGKKIQKRKAKKATKKSKPKKQKAAKAIPRNTNHHQSKTPPFTPVPTQNRPHTKMLYFLPEIMIPT
jgi:hypothetical protein